MCDQWEAAYTQGCKARRPFYIIQTETGLLSTLEEYETSTATVDILATINESFVEILGKSVVLLDSSIKETLCKFQARLFVFQHN